MKKQAIILIAGIIIIMTGLPLYAAEAEQTTALDEMVVTAGRAEEARRDMTVNVMVIDRREIEMSTAKDLGQLLADQSIGHIQGYPGALTSFGIRGFRGNALGNDLMGYVLVLIDGRRAGTGNVAHLSLDNVEKIEIIRGPSSVQYGSAAIGGLVNVITKRGSGNPSVSVGGKLGSFGYEETSAGVTGEIGGFDLALSAKRSMRDDYDTADGDKYFNTGNGANEKVSINLGYTFLPENRVGLIYTTSDIDKAGSPSYLSQNDLDDYSNREYETWDVVYDGQTGDGALSWKARYFEGENTYDYMDPIASNPDFWDDGLISEYETEQKGAQVQLTWKPGSHQITAGIDWVNYEVGETYPDGTSEYDNPAAFALGKFKLVDERLILSGGLRYDSYDVDTVATTKTSADDTNLAPSVGVAFLPIDSLKLRVNYAEGFKMPSARELAASYDSWGVHYEGEANLDPEKSRSYEIGADYAVSGVSASLTWFHTDFQDKITETNDPDHPGGRTWENLGDATVSGIEGEASFDLGDVFDLGWELRPYATFVYLSEYEDEEADEDLKYTADLRASYGVSLSDYDGLSADLGFAYTGEEVYEDYESGYPAPIRESGGYTTANLSIKKRLVSFDSAGDMTLATEIRNLTNKRYAHVAGYPAPGRSYYAGLTYKY